MPSKKAIFVHCGELSEEDVSIGVAIMTTVDRGEARRGRTEKLYIMIPFDPNEARELERIFFVTSSDERVIEVRIDKNSQEQIDRREG